MGLLIRIEQCMPNVDEVEIHIVDECAPQVGVAQIGFADFLRGFEILFVIIVGVKPGPASLAGNRTAHQAIAGRAEMKRNAVQVGIAQRRPLPVDFRQTGPYQASAVENGIGHHRVG